MPRTTTIDDGIACFHEAALILLCMAHRRCDNKLSSIVVAAAQRSDKDLVVELYVLSVQQGHHEGASGGDDVSDAAIEQRPPTVSACQQQPPGKHVAVADVDLAVLPFLQGIP